MGCEWMCEPLHWWTALYGSRVSFHLLIFTMHIVNGVVFNDIGDVDGGAADDEN